MRTLPLLLLAACVESPDVSTTSEALNNACASNETLGDRVIGFYDATAGQPFNHNGVTVYDYRKCSQSLHGGDYLDGTIVANSLGTSVPAFAADATAPYPSGAYRVYAPDTAHQNHKLLIYLSGSPDDNSNKEQLLQRAAYHGYHVVAVRYWNDDGGTIGACGKGPSASTGLFSAHHGCTSADPPDQCNPYTGNTPITYDDCVIRFYRNVFENAAPDFTHAHIGPINSLCAPNSSDTDRCDGTAVGRSLTNGDAAKYRVRKLLSYLSQRHPADGWDQFAGASGYDSAPYFDWTNITVMGHSAGSKTIVHLAHDVAIDRVILLSGPNLGPTRAGMTPPGNLDSYFTTSSATTLDRIYAFSNTHDDNFSLAVPNWNFITSGFQHGLDGATGSGGWESKQTCSGACLPCLENQPIAPPPGSPIRAIQYSGNASYCLGKSGPFDPIDGPNDATGSFEHMSTTENSSCAASSNHDPEGCWYIKIWDYLLGN